MIADLKASFGVGEISMSISVIAWALYTILGRKALGRLSPLATTTYAALFGFLMLAGFTLASTPLESLAIPSATSLGAIAYLAIGGTVVPFVWYYQGVQALGPERTAVFNNLIPVFGVLLGAALLAEPISLSMALGGALVIAGVSLTNRR